MFELFGNKNKHFVGVDFGTGYLKVVELSYKNRQVCLESYAVVNLAWMVSSSTRNTLEEKLALSLKIALQKSGIKTKNINVALPSFVGLVTIIAFPKMKDAELADALKFEIHRHIPDSMGDMAVSWEVLKKNASAASASQDEKQEVLLVAAPKKEIGKYEQVIEGANLGVDSIELETFSITRAFSFGQDGDMLIIDIGSRATNIIFLDKGVMRMNRNFGVGGDDITEAIADAMNISKQRAESMKKSSNDLLNSKEKISIPAIERIAEEALRFLAFYEKEHAGVKIGGIFLSGGSSGMRGLDTYLTKVLGSPVAIGNPWKNIQYDPKLKKSVESLGASFSVAIGLAMREIIELNSAAS